MDWLFNPGKGGDANAPTKLVKMTYSILHRAKHTILM